MNEQNIRRSACVVVVLLGFACVETAQAASATVCDAYARNYSKDTKRQGQVLGGAIVGSAVGLGLVAITGGAAAVGLAAGGGLGILGGGSKRRKDADRIYDAAFADCMAGKVQ